MQPSRGVSEIECRSCGRQSRTAGCPCGASWPSAGRTYGWLVAGLLLLPLGAGAAYGGWLLARRTVLERAHLGVEATLTGAVLVGVLFAVAMAGPLALSRGWLSLRERRRKREELAPSRTTTALEGIDRGLSGLARVAARVPRGVAPGLVACGVLLWIVSFGAAALLARPIFVAVTVLAWIAVPAGVLLDADGSPRRRWVAALSVVPYVAAPVGLGYLFVRRLDGS